VLAVVGPALAAGRSIDGDDRLIDPVEREKGRRVRAPAGGSASKFFREIIIDEVDRAG
jgi:hypothetical protein